MRSWEQIDGVLKAVSFGVDHGFNPTMNQPRFGGELAPIVGRSGHDRVAIGPRSNRDRESCLIAAVRSLPFVYDGSTSSTSVAHPMEIPALQKVPRIAKVRGRSGSIVAV